MPPKAKTTKRKNRFKLSEMRAERAEALGGEYVEIEDDDGELLVRIPRAGFWDAQTYEELVESGRVMRDMATLEQIMDPDQFAKLLGLAPQLGDMKDLVAEVMRDVDSPE